MNFISKLSLSNDNFLIFIFTFTLLSFVMDIFTNPCFLHLIDNENHATFEKFSILQFLFVHHLLAVVLYFGWLSPSRTFLQFYVLLVVLILFHWMTNNQRCILTQIINRYCGYDDNELFHDIFYILNMKNQPWFDPFIYIYLFWGFTISLIKITYL